MPTGYTAYIEDGDIATGKEFLKLCVRAFGIAIDLKDEPLSVPTPTHFEPDTYYKEIYEKALEELNKANNLTFDEAKIQMKAAYERRISDYKSWAEKEVAMNQKYAKVRKEVEEWIPPTEEHQDLKKFALEQIDMCVTKQEHIDEYLEKSKEIFDNSDEAVEKYISENIQYCKKIWIEHIRVGKKNLNEQRKRIYGLKSSWKVSDKTEFLFG